MVYNWLINNVTHEFLGVSITMYYMECFPFYRHPLDLRLDLSPAVFKVFLLHNFL